MLLSAIGAGISLGSAILGGAKAAKAARQADNLINQQKTENENWYNQRYNEDYSSTAEAQNLLNYARKQADEQFRRAEGAAAVSGASDESVALAKRSANEMLGQTAANIAAQGTARKDAIEQQYLNTKNSLTQQQVANLQAKAQNISNAAGQASGSFGSIAGSALNSLFGKK